MPSVELAIIDYKVSNMFSIFSACNHFGIDVRITHDKDTILNAKAAILPGVGAFEPAMCHLHDMGLVSVIHDFIHSKKPFMGICLGMQLLMTQSEEFGEHQGLNIIPGKVKRFSSNSESVANYRLPHIGWNKIKIGLNAKSWKESPLKNINNNEYMYFVHSYYVDPDNKDVIVSCTNYADINFCSSMSQENIFACQFHPEKSGIEGLKILSQFAKFIKSR